MSSSRKRLASVVDNHSFDNYLDRDEPRRHPARATVRVHLTKPRNWEAALGSIQTHSLFRFPSFHTEVLNLLVGEGLDEEVWLERLIEAGFDLARTGLRPQGLNIAESIMFNFFCRTCDTSTPLLSGKCASRLLKECRPDAMWDGRNLAVHAVTSIITIDPLIKTSVRGFIPRLHWAKAMIFYDDFDSSIVDAQLPLWINGKDVSSTLPELFETWAIDIRHPFDRQVYNTMVEYMKRRGLPMDWLLRWCKFMIPIADRQWLINTVRHAITDDHKFAIDDVRKALLEHDCPYDPTSGEYQQKFLAMLSDWVD